MSCKKNIKSIIALEICQNFSVPDPARDASAAVFCEHSSLVGSGCRGHFNYKRTEQ